MTGAQLATLSTIAWLVLTIALIVVLGTWSAGGSWSILPGLARGIHGWSDGSAPADPEPSKATEAAATIDEDRVTPLG